MEPAAIASHRFGLGTRRDEGLPQNPRDWLARQIEAFDPNPPALGGKRHSREAVAYTADRLRRVRQARQETRQENAMTPEQMAAMDAGDRSNVPSMVQEINREGRSGLREDMARKVNAALASETPFMERMVHFWSNHFSVSTTRPPMINIAGPMEFDAIRPNITGNFASLLKPAALHPAMLVYLDQYQSIGPNSVAAQRARQRQRQRGLNENLAREILELHTLGVEGGYSQADVTEFARALTGWTITGISGGGNRHRAGGQAVGAHGASFARFLHEPGKRTILGKSYTQEGPDLAHAILDDLAAHPSTATFVATKLARHFAGDEPPAALVGTLERTFRQTDGDLPSLYRALIDAPEAWVAGPVKFRQPFEWTIAVMRGMGLEQARGRQFANMLNQLGQMPWQATSPAGYDDIAASWLGPDALVRRTEVAQQIAQRAPNMDARKLAAELFGNSLTPATSTAIARADNPSQALALLFVSPEMLRR